MFNPAAKIGILGGGQLGKMLCQAASNWDLNTHVLDQPGAPAACVCRQFHAGDFTKKEDVMQFGMDMDIITIEIEKVNLEALYALEKAGKKVFPAPAALEIIRDKGLQKLFFEKNDLPTAPFSLFNNEADLLRAVENGEITLPFVQKTRTDGYDGRGVAIMRNPEDLETKLLKGPCIAEALADMEMEIAVMAAMNPRGEIATYPAVEMDFHPEANLVELLICPARISPLIEAEAEALAEKIIRELGVCGLLAVEMFVTKKGEIWINEVAPRPHNSGHHTIDSAITSQYEQHLRAICDMPLGNTAQNAFAAMVNILGAPGFTGPAIYEGMEECLKMPGVYIHLYGKTTTAPFRKMGHATITGESMEEVLDMAERVRYAIRVVS